MKKRLLMLTLCGVLSASLLIGCGTEPETVVTTEEPVQEETVEEETPAEDTEDVVSEDEADVEADEETDETPDFIGTLVAPEGYEYYTWGSAPLSSVYLLLGYSSYVSDSDDTLESIGLEGLEPEEFVIALDELCGIDAESETADEDRDSYLVMLLGFSGLCESEDQISDFLAGTWVPDGTVYTDVDFSGANLDDFERQNSEAVTVLGDDYTLWTEIGSNGIDDDGVATGYIAYWFYTADGSDNGLNVDSFEIEYTGDLDLTIDSTVAETGETGDKVIITVNYSVADATEDDVVFTSDFTLTDTDGNVIK